MEKVYRFRITETITREALVIGFAPGTKAGLENATAHIEYLLNTVIIKDPTGTLTIGRTLNIEEIK